MATHSSTLEWRTLENPMDRGAWRATVHGVATSQTWLRPYTHISPVPRKVLGRAGSQDFWLNIWWGHRWLPKPEFQKGEVACTARTWSGWGWTQTHWVPSPLFRLLPSSLLPASLTVGSSLLQAGHTYHHWGPETPSSCHSVTKNPQCLSAASRWCSDSLAHLPMIFKIWTSCYYFPLKLPQKSTSLVLSPPSILILSSRSFEMIHLSCPSLWIPSHPLGFAHVAPLQWSFWLSQHAVISHFPERTNLSLSVLLSRQLGNVPCDCWSC